MDIMAHALLLAFADLQQFSLQPLSHRNFGCELCGTFDRPSFQIVMQFARFGDQLCHEDKSRKASRQIPQRNHDARVMRSCRKVSSHPKNGTQNSQGVRDRAFQEPSRDADGKR